MERLARELQDTTDKFNRIKGSLEDVVAAGIDLSTAAPHVKRRGSDRYPRVDSYLAHVMATDLSNLSRPNERCYFEAAHRQCLQLGTQHDALRDVNRKEAMIPTRQVPDTFYTTRSDATTPFEFSRFLLELSSEPWAILPDASRMIDSRSHKSYLPIRTQNDSLKANRDIRI